MCKVEDRGNGMYWFYCPGCKDKHIYFTNRDNGYGKAWEFNGNVDKPTFTPSLLNRWGKNADPKWIEPNETPPEDGWSGICHLFVTDGKIVYCSDCTHSLAGQTVEMQSFPLPKNN